MRRHLRPTAPIATDVLLPGDPGLALALAQHLLERPRMANHDHGLWGYSGTARGGRELTIQATGIGAQSAAVVLAELVEHGARRLIRVGRVTALDRSLELGELIVAEAAIRGDRSSRMLAGAGRAHPDPELHSALRAAGGAEVRASLVASADLPELAGRRVEPEPANGAAARDLETATLFALGRDLGVAVAAAAVVTIAANGVEAAPETLAERSLRLGEIAALALAARATGRTGAVAPQPSSSGTVSFS